MLNHSLSSQPQVPTPVSAPAQYQPHQDFPPCTQHSPSQSITTHALPSGNLFAAHWNQAIPPGNLFAAHRNQATPEGNPLTTPQPQQRHSDHGNSGQSQTPETRYLSPQPQSTSPGHLPSTPQQARSHPAPNIAGPQPHPLQEHRPSEAATSADRENDRLRQRSRPQAGDYH